MPYPVAFGPLTLTSVGAASNGVTVYSGTITNGGSNAFVGLRAFIVGFLLQDGVNNSNQDGFLVTASSAGTLTVANPLGMSETAVGSAYLLAVNLPTNAIADAGAPFPIPNFSGPYSVTGQGTAPATGVSQGGLNPDLGSPGSPGGKSLVARNWFSGWNFSNSELSTQNLLAALTAARDNGTPWTVVSAYTPGPAKNIAQTTPSAPSGSYTQQGSPALTNVTSVTLAGFAPGQLSFVQSSGAYQKA